MNLHLRYSSYNCAPCQCRFDFCWLQSKPRRAIAVPARPGCTEIDAFSLSTLSSSGGKWSMLAISGGLPKRSSNEIYAETAALENCIQTEWALGCVSCSGDLSVPSIHGIFGPAFVRSQQFQHVPTFHAGNFSAALLSRAGGPHSVVVVMMHTATVR